MFIEGKAIVPSAGNSTRVVTQTEGFGQSLHSSVRSQEVIKPGMATVWCRMTLVSHTGNGRKVAFLEVPLG